MDRNLLPNALGFSSPSACFCHKCYSRFSREKPKIPIYVSSNEEKDVTTHLVMAKIKTEEKSVDKPRKNSVGEYPFKFLEKNYNRKSLEGRFQKKIQIAVSRTEHTVITESVKVIHRLHISRPFVFQTKKKEGTATANRRQNHAEKSTLSPGRRQKIRSVEILRDILNGKSKTNHEKLKQYREAKKAKLTKKVISKWKLRTHPKETGTSQSVKPRR